MNVLTLDRLQSKCPSIMTETPFTGVSQRYTQVPTIEVIKTLMQEGWKPVSCMEKKVRVDERMGFQKHLIRFQHPDLQLGDENVETVLVNSHDRSCAFQFYLGIFRIACTNGLVVGDQFKRISVKHKDTHADNIIEASFKIITEAPAVVESVKEMKAIDLAPGERGVLARTALSYLTDTPYEKVEELPYKPEALLGHRRYDDDKSNLWTTFNVIQENVMKGGIRGFNPETRKRVKTRAIQSIDRNLKLNQALWTMAEEMKKLKKETHP